MSFAILFYAFGFSFIGQPSNAIPSTEVVLYISSETTTAEDSTRFTPLFSYADQYPEYPGGTEEMINYIRENIVYPELAYDHGHEGTVLVEFIIEADGSIKKARVLKKIGLGCDEAALAVFKHMPRWQPAVRAGKRIAVRCITPVKFTLF